MNADENAKLKVAKKKKLHVVADIGMSDTCFTSAFFIVAVLFIIMITIGIAADKLGSINDTLRETLREQNYIARKQLEVSEAQKNRQLSCGCSR